MPDRRCKHLFSMVSDYLNAELPVKNCRELERHLEGCEPCIAYLESLRRAVEACRRYQVAKLPPPSKKVRDAFLHFFHRAERKKLPRSAAHARAARVRA